MGEATVKRSINAIHLLFPICYLLARKERVLSVSKQQASSTGQEEHKEFRSAFRKMRILLTEQMNQAVHNVGWNLIESLRLAAGAGGVFGT